MNRCSCATVKGGALALCLLFAVLLALGSLQQAAVELSALLAGSESQRFYVHLGIGVGALLLVVLVVYCPCCQVTLRSMRKAPVLSGFTRNAGLGLAPPTQPPSPMSQSSGPSGRLYGGGGVCY